MTAVIYKYRGTSINGRTVNDLMTTVDNRFHLCLPLKDYGSEIVEIIYYLRDNFKDIAKQT